MPTPRRAAIKSARKQVKSLKKTRRKYIKKGVIGPEGKGRTTATKRQRKETVATEELKRGTLKKAKAKLKTAKKSRPKKAAKKADIKNIKGAKLTTRRGKTKDITSKRAARIKKKVFKKAVKGKQKSTYSTTGGYQAGHYVPRVSGRGVVKAYETLPTKVTITKKSKKGKTKKKLTYRTKK